MSSTEPLSNNYSDHSVLCMTVGPLKLRQLNVAQLGRLQMFPDREQGFTWSSTLRTAFILKQIAQKSPELRIIGSRLLDIAKSESLTISEKNSAIEVESLLVIIELNKIGFSAKSFKMSSSKLFNPDVLPNLLWQKPDDYIKAPSFVLEDSNSFSTRIENGFSVMFDDDDVDIVTAQEIEFGESDNIDFTAVHKSALDLHDSYNFVAPCMQKNATVSATYFKNIFDNVTDQNTCKLNELRAKMKCFNDSDLKILIIMLEHRQTKQVYTVVNVHAEYPKANSEGPWKVLREIFDDIANLIVCGDFNLMLKNKPYFENAFADFIKQESGHYCILQTPEPDDIGNPTYDLMISNII